MDAIVETIGGVKPSDIRFNNDDDAIDKLSHRYTPLLLVIFTLIVSTKSYVGDPIDCWVPAHFSDPWEEYADWYCWVKNTYYLPVEEDTDIPKPHEKHNYLTYYQWVPLLLLAQALIFLIPRRIWRSLNSRCAVDLDNMVEQANKIKDAEVQDDKEDTQKMMVNQMHRFLESGGTYKGGCTLSLKDCIARVCCPVCGRRSGNYLTLAYILSKMLYTANVIGQLFLMDAWLGSDYHLYGIDVLTDVFNKVDWKDSYRFPRVTMCDFVIRRLGNLNRYTVQCVLSINLFNEMIYLFLWFWLVFIAFLSALSMIKWALCMFSKRDRMRFIKKHLMLAEQLVNREKIPTKKERDDQENLLREFVHTYLKSDGVFICRLVGVNTDTVTVNDFIGMLWAKYKADKEKDDTASTAEMPPMGLDLPDGDHPKAAEARAEASR